MIRFHHRALVCSSLLLAALTCHVRAQSIGLPWSGHGHDPQHTGLSQVTSKAMERILWQTPVDLAPQYVGTTLYAHYGSPVITRQNTVIVPVKTGANDGFRIEAHDGATGGMKWQVTTGYTLPAHNWVPHYGVALTPKNRVCFADAGGTVSYRDNPDAAGGATGQMAFYGMPTYVSDSATFDANVRINTPITTDRYGNLFFGFVVSGTTTPALQSGIARIAEDGTGSWVSASSAADDASVIRLPHNLAPALSNDHKSLYFAVVDGNGFGYLLMLDSRTLETTGKVRLKDVLSPVDDARLLDDGTAAPMVGPDGDVYFGVFEHSWGVNHYRGWLRHYDKTLTQAKASGAFGWDHTPSVVPASLVASYQGTSKYLLLSKYNNYAGVGGDGRNKLAVLDPNDTQTDAVTGATVMKEILTVLGPTPDDEYPSVDGAVREWCVNTVAIDVAKKSAIVHSEDGKVYRWDFKTNTLIEPLTLTPGIGEAYTPSVIGVDGTVYVIANAVLFAIGEGAP
ncbi:hypothetical protein [Prosthecobacter sp.]|uniref:hypothetical protein n=1 Tax=Prosthecobacter sp. TaxID=1965333 RepID=UPI0037832B4E